jgi:hypothetical protein
MNAQSSSSGDDFRIIDLFSPSEPTSSFPTADRETPRSPSASRMSGDLPESFLFANPLFARDAQAHRGE